MKYKYPPRYLWKRKVFKKQSPLPLPTRKRQLHQSGFAFANTDRLDRLRFQGFARNHESPRRSRGGQDGHWGCRRGLDGLGKNPSPPTSRSRSRSELRNSRRRIGVSAIGESASQELAGAESQAPSEPLWIPFFITRLPSRCTFQAWFISLLVLYVYFFMLNLFLWHVGFHGIGASW